MKSAENLFWLFIRSLRDDLPKVCGKEKRLAKGYMVYALTEFEGE
jgi:hypothetical protein